MKPRWRTDLESYFAGQLESDAGLRSWLGRWDGGGPVRGGTSYVTPPEPAGAALESARVARRVERALASIARQDRLVIAALHAPRPPAGLDRGAWVAVVIEDRVQAILEEESVERRSRGEHRLRGALRSGDLGEARYALELAPLATPSSTPVLDALRALLATQGAPARRLLRRVDQELRRAEGSALEAFERAWNAAVAAERTERAARFRAALDG